MGGMRGAIAGIAVLLAAVAARGQPADVVRDLPAEAGRAGGALYVPPNAPPGALPVVVALPVEGVSARTFLLSLRALADDGGYALLCPSPGGAKFAAEDLDLVVAAAEGVRATTGGGPLHLLGVDDSAWAALRFAYARPKVFRTVTSLGADLPAERPPRGTEGLRVLVLKGADDRPAAGRESVEAVRSCFERAEFRVLPGDGRTLDLAARNAVLSFLDAASGRAAAGRDQSLPWLEPGPGLAERARRKVPALVYFYDDAPAHAARTERIQGEILSDPRVRRAAEGAVAVLAPRAEAEKLLPDAKLGPGPAIVVLDAEGKVAGVAQQKAGAAAVAALLSGR